MADPRAGKVAGSVQPRGKLTLAKILREGLARKQFEFLVSHKVDRDFLQGSLTRIPFASTKKPPLVSGVDDSALQNLPGNLDAMAARLERLNASSYLSPMKVLPHFHEADRVHLEPISSRSAEAVRKEMGMAFSILPTLLRNLAGCLRACLSQVTRMKGNKINLRVSDRQFELLALLVHVKNKTDSPRFMRVAGLVNAAFWAAGVPARGNKFAVSVRGLKRLWKKNPLVRLVISTAPEFYPNR